MKRRVFRSLYWRLSAVFLLLLLLVGAAYVYLTLFATDMYFAETNQRLNATLAQHIADEIHPFVEGKFNVQSLDEIFHDVMVVNPSVEVYLLDAEGRILAFDAPKEKVKVSSVSLRPIREFLASNGRSLVLGDNPRDVGRPKVFSAAPVYAGSSLQGYVYVILSSEEYDSVAGRIFSSHILTFGLRALLVSLVAAACVGLIAFAIMTRKLHRITQTVLAFKDGNYAERIPTKGSDEFDQLATAYNAMAGTIESQVDELKRTDALRRELIANVSHDLRTPLASIQGYMETILMKNDTLGPQERSEHLNVILKNTERLHRLVHELFELSKLEARQTLPRPEPFSLAELVSDLVQKFAPEGKKRCITITADLPRDLPQVMADIGLIERVLQNLIENAIQHTPESGKVEVCLRLSPSHNLPLSAPSETGTRRAGGRVTISVSDTGTGIPSEDLPFIFQRFYRARKGASSSGAGLGLAIVQKILEAHGTSIQVESAVDRGTIFAFDLPAATPSGS